MLYQEKQQWSFLSQRFAGAAGILILLTSIYFALIMPAFGFEFSMLDDYTKKISWYTNNDTAGGIFQGLMMLYFISQLVLLPLPFAIHKVLAKGHNRVYSTLFAMIGTAGAIIAMVGPVIIFANTPELVRVAQEGLIQSEVIEMNAHMFADLTKDFRLFSELLIGIWLMGVGFLFAKSNKQNLLFYSIGLLGIAILIIPAVKLIYPYNPIEDFIGVLLACAFFLIMSTIYRYNQTEKLN